MRRSHPLYCGPTRGGTITCCMIPPISGSVEPSPSSFRSYPASYGKSGNPLLLPPMWTFADISTNSTRITTSLMIPTCQVCVPFNPMATATQAMVHTPLPRTPVSREGLRQRTTWHFTCSPAGLTACITICLRVLHARIEAIISASKKFLFRLEAKEGTDWPSFRLHWATDCGTLSTVAKG